MSSFSAGMNEYHPAKFPVLFIFLLFSFATFMIPDLMISLYSVCFIDTEFALKYSFWFAMFYCLSFYPNIVNEQVLVQQPTWRIIQRGIIINGHASNYMHLAKFLIFRNWVLTEVNNGSLADFIASNEKDHAPMVFNRVLLPEELRILR